MPGNSALIFDIVARDKASKVMDQTGDSAKRNTGKWEKFGTVANVALAGVAVAAGKFAVDSVKAYADAQQSQQRLSDAYKRFPKLADVSIGSLQKLNTALEAKTRFDDDATASGQAVLAQFNLTGKQIQQLTPLLQDYAAKTGQDLPTAAGSLGKALLGQGRALKQVGIDFKDTGSTAGNFDEIVAGLRTQVGGFAQKEGKTAAGQAEILKNQFGEVQEQVGKTLMPTLTKLAKTLTNVALWVQNNTTAAIALGTAFGVLTTAIVVAAHWTAIVTTATRIAAAAQWLWNAALSANPIGLVITAIGALVAALVWFFTKTEVGRRIVTNAWNGIKAAIKGVTDWWTRVAYPAMVRGIDAIKNGFHNAAGAIGRSWEGIKAAAAKPVNFILGTVYNDGIAHWWNTIANAVGMSRLKLPAAHLIKFAQGSEDHRAQIARGGAMRLWAEPETGGEAYIPLSPGKRGRSTTILSQVAEKFGYGLTKFAGGGFWGNVTGFLSNPAGMVTRGLGSLVHGLLGRIGGGSLGQMLSALPTKIVSGLSGVVKNLFAGGGGGTGGPANAIGWKAMADIVRGHFPGARISSGFRPGAMTATGFRSYHALGRAIDIVGPDMVGIFRWLAQAYPNSRELFHTPAGVQNWIRNGKTGQRFAPVTIRDHYSHVHWAMANGGLLYDQGGWLPSGGVAVNRSGRPEAVLSPSQSKALEDGQLDLSERSLQRLAQLMSGAAGVALANDARRSGGGRSTYGVR